MSRKLDAQHYNIIAKLLADFYPTESQVTSVLVSSGVRLPSIDFHGSADLIWDSVLAYAEHNNVLPGLLAIAFQDYARVERVNQVMEDINSGKAFLPAVPDFIFPNIATDTEIPTVLIISEVSDNSNLAGLLAHLRVSVSFGEYRLKHCIAPSLGDIEMSKEIDQCMMALAVLSPNFFLNNECLSAIFECVEKQKRIVPILLRECVYARMSQLKRIQPLPRDGSFILSDLSQKNHKEYLVAKEISELVDRLKQKR